jgi:VIT1/CCC1 family predicted Fe2+/Mn2+ transporter
MKEVQMAISDKAKLARVLALQRKEITEYYVYKRLARLCRDEGNAGVLRALAGAEKDHAAFWQSKTGMSVKPAMIGVILTIASARIFGLTFTLKRMEKDEGLAQKTYEALLEDFPDARALMEQEDEHEKQLLVLLDEELLRYVGSIVLGLNDALVELTGALAGFTLALGSAKLISLAGLVTGISAALSMAASDYLSSKTDGDSRAAKSALYTGGAYLLTVAILILPFLLLGNPFVALGVTLLAAVCIIFCFNYYLATAKDLNFKKRFLEMSVISLGVAAVSFGISWALKNFLGVDV